MHHNIQGLNSKYLEFAVITEKVLPDVICISEHWFVHSDIEAFNLRGYKLASYSSRSQFIRGGTVIFVRDTGSVNEVESNVTVVEKHFEFTVCELMVGNRKLVIVCLYRSPVGDVDVFFSKLAVVLDEVYSPDKSLIVAADFNFHFELNDAHSVSLCQLLLCYGLVPHINGVTRPKSNAQLDNVFSNMEGIQGDIYVTDISDHYAQLINTSFPINSKQLKQVRRRRFSDGNILTFRGYLERERWLEVYDACEPCEKFNKFNLTFKYYFDISFPIITSRVRDERSWVTHLIKARANVLKDLYVNFQITKSPIALAQYRQERKAYRKFLSEYRKKLNHEKILRSKNKSKTLWSIFNTETNKIKSHHSIILKNDDNVIIKNSKTVANLFLNHFSIVNDTSSRVLPNSINNYPSLFFGPTDRSEVYRVIMNFTNKYSSGLDEVPIFVLKRVAELVCDPLADIINNCFVGGVFPNDLKKAIVVPIYKKGDHSNINNYRPISLLPSVSKVFERVIYNRLIGHLDRNHVLSDRQFGFRSDRSTELAIFETLSTIYERLDVGEKVAGLYFDLSRAFDTIDHQILQQVLSNYGIRGVALDLITSYLTQRQQIVCVEGEISKYYSEWGNIEQGVPQGSILGPLLFLLYVNNIGRDIESAPDVGTSLRRVCQYADDTSAVIAAASYADLSLSCSHVAGQMSDWCKNNCLRLNTSKTGLITYSKTSGLDQSLYVKLNHKSLPIAESVKFLGVILDSRLTWEQHAAALKSKLSSTCGMMRRLRQVVSLESFRIFYFSNVQSVIAYGIVFWGSSSFAEGVFRAQKRIIRCMLHMGPRSSCRPKFPALGILTVPSLYCFHLVMFVRKHRHLFPLNSDFYADNMDIITRSRNELSIPTHNSSFYEKGPYYKAIKAYRNLPLELKCIVDNGVFRRAVTSYLVNKCYYKNCEFLN